MRRVLKSIETLQKLFSSFFSLSFFLHTPLRRLCARARACYYTARRFSLSTRGERLAFLFVLLTLSHRSLTLYPARFIARHTHRTQPRCHRWPRANTRAVRVCESCAYSLRHLLAIQNPKRPRSAMHLSRFYLMTRTITDLLILQLFHASPISDNTISR